MNAENGKALIYIPEKRPPLPKSKKRSVALGSDTPCLGTRGESKGQKAATLAGPKDLLS